MDNLLSKPIDAVQFAALLEHYRTESIAEQSPLDNERLLDQSAGDRQTATELISMFMKERETILDPIVRAIQERDTAELEQAALKLMGTFGSLAAPRATEAASRLERLGRLGDLDQAQDALAVLRTEIGLLEGELRSFASRTA